MSVLVLEQGEPWARALRRAREFQLHHGVLLEGPRGTGKSTAARRLAQALLCPSPAGESPCGGCDVCHRVSSGAYPDLHLLTVPPDKREIPVDDVRALRVALQRSAVEGRARVAIVDPADRLNEQGQNALLKTLEEPGQGAWLILAASRPEALLETVRSRVLRLRLRPVSAATLARILEERGLGDPESRARAVELAQGSVGMAIDLLDPEMQRVQQELVSFLAARNDMSAVRVARAVLDGAKDPAEAERRARAALRILHASLRDHGRTALVGEGGARYSPRAFDRWLTDHEALFEAEADLDLRIAPEAVLTALLLRLQRGE